MEYSSLSLALTGVVPAACDAEAGEYHEVQTESHGPSSLRWIHQETFSVIGHDASTVSNPRKSQEART